jgi:hypothetical protein
MKNVLATLYKLQPVQVQGRPQFHAPRSHRIDQQLKATPPLPTRATTLRPSIGTGASAAQGATNDDQSQIAA